MAQHFLLLDNVFTNVLGYSSKKKQLLLEVYIQSSNSFEAVDAFIFYL